MNHQCRVCGNSEHELILDLGEQPWCNNFLRKEEVGKEVYYPLRLVYCIKCKTAQLDHTVSKEIMFSDHTYLSGVTKSLSNHFAKVAEEAIKIKSNKDAMRVLDIGSNDGSQLVEYKLRGCEVLGVESSLRTSNIAISKGIPTIRAYFNKDVADSLDTKYDIVNASGVFFHLEELHSVTEGIKQVLDEDGIFIVQFLYIGSIQKNVAFDQIYHEHLLYYSLETLQTLLSKYSLEIFDTYLANIHGGQMIAYISHRGKKQKSQRYSEMITIEELNRVNEIETYKKLSSDVEFSRNKSIGFLDDCISRGKIVYGLGAPVKGNTLLNYFNIGTDKLKYLVERNPLRRGLYSPGKHIPILMEDEVEESPNAYFVLAWNFKSEIMKRHSSDFNSGVEFFFPVEVKP